MLMTNHLVMATRLRYAAGLIGGVVSPFILYNLSQKAVINLVDLKGMFIVATIIFTLTLLGELCERYLFFAAIVSKKMPGDV